MKTPTPDKDGRCVCFAHSEDECACGAWHKPAPMAWHKFPDEKPTETGWYLTINYGMVYSVKYCDTKYRNQYLRSWNSVVNWCLITPPESEEK